MTTPGGQRRLLTEADIVAAGIARGEQIRLSDEQCDQLAVLVAPALEADQPTPTETTRRAA